MEQLRYALERCRTVLSNMALEDTGPIFGRRWPIHHEPLRADAKNLLPIIDAALAEQSEVSAEDRTIECAIGGSYEMPDGRKFWIDGPVAREMTRRVQAAIQSERTKAASSAA